MITYVISHALPSVLKAIETNQIVNIEEELDYYRNIAVTDAPKQYVYVSPTKTVVTVDSSTSPRLETPINNSSPTKRSVRFHFEDNYKAEEYDDMKDRVTSIDSDYRELKGKLNSIKSEIDNEITRKGGSPVKGLSPMQPIVLHASKSSDILIKPKKREVPLFKRMEAEAAKMELEKEKLKLGY